MEKVFYYGLPFCLVLFGIWFILKLLGVLAWSWWWIFAPLWVPFGFVLIFFLIEIVALYWRMNKSK